MMDCIIASKDNRQIKCKYYEVEEKCKDIIREEINKKPTLKTEFQNFSQNYTYFHPYFDFVLTRLDCVIYNPFDLEAACLYGEKEIIHFLHLNQDYEFLPLSDDKHIGLYKVSTMHLENSLVDKDLNGIAPKGLLHRDIARLILNNYFITDAELYQKYLNECENFYFFDYKKFLEFHKSYVRLAKDKKNERNKHYAVFQNCDVFYQITAYQENLSEAQKKWIEELVTSNIISEDNIIYFEELEKRRTQ